MDRLARRRAKDYTVKAISTGFALISLFMLAWILFTLIERGLPALGSNVFTHVMLPPGESGGLLNAIVGSLIQIGVALLIGTPIGVMAGTYLAEPGRGGKLRGNASASSTTSSCRRRRSSSAFSSTR